MRRLLLSVLTLVAVLVAGCGGSKSSSTDPKAYQKELNSTSAALRKTFSDVGAGLSSTSSLSALAKSLDNGAGALNKAADAFDKITPPDKAKAGHDELVTGLHELASSFTSSAKVTRGGDKTKIASAMQSIQASAGTKKITDAETKLKKAGFTLPGSAP